MSEGTVFRRSDGRWCAKYKDAHGSWRYLYRKSKGEAKKALRAVLKDRDEGLTPPSKITVGTYLDEWLEDMRDTVSHRTWVTREGFVRNHIRPAIGTKRLSALTADDAGRLYKRKLAEGLAPSRMEDAPFPFRWYAASLTCFGGRTEWETYLVYVRSINISCYLR